MNCLLLMHSKIWAIKGNENISQLKCALNLHLIYIKKNANQALNMVLFMLWCSYCTLNSSQKAPLEGALSGSNFKILMLN